MKNILTLLSLFILQSGLDAQALSGIKTVGGNAPDYNNLQAAVNDLNSMGVGPDGVTFAIRPGEYSESLLITARGTESGRIRFVSENEDASSVKIFFSGSGDVIRLQNAAFVSFEMLSISFSGTGSYNAVEIQDNSDDIAIRNCVLEGSSVSGTAYAAAVIYASETTALNDCDRLNIADNIIRYGSYGIALSMSLSQPAGTMIRKNRIEDFYGSGMYLAKLSNLSIEHNSISTVQTGNSSAKGIELDNCDGMHRINGNYIYTREEGRLGYGLHFEGSASTEGAEILVTNNSIQVSNTNSICYGIYQSNNSNWYLYHSNTIYVSAGTSVAGNCYNTYNAAKDTWLFNNIFVNAGTATGVNVNRAVIIANTTAIAGAGHNCYFTVNDGNPFKASFGSNYSNYQDYAAAIGETSGLNIDPQMIFVEGKGWKAGNPALTGMGADTVFIQEDIDGNMRFQPTTIGAHELQIVTGELHPQNLSLAVYSSQNRIVVKSASKISSIFISDLSGKMLFNESISVHNGEFYLPFSAPSHGVYIVSVLTAGEIRSFKIPLFFSVQ